MLEEKIDALIAVIEQNTCALLNGSLAPTYVPEEPASTRPEESRANTKPDNSAKRKKATTAKEKKAAADTATKGGKITVESVKVLAKKIALASDDPKECMNQIREIVGEIAESCYGNANAGIDKFDTTGLILLQEELAKFIYTPLEPENADNNDNLEI